MGYPYPPLTTFTFFIISANLLILPASSTDHCHGDFFVCLTDQFRSSNSPTDAIHTPQNSTYASLLRAQNLRAQSNSLTRPDLIITPNHESEIQAAIYCSRELGLSIRVRSGGHDYEGLSYISEIPFVIIDMRNFQSINIDVKTAWVQVGATLGQLYYALAQKSKTLAFPAGVCPTVGVGGHFSGGGYGMMSRKHSIAVDHIIDARLINAAGEILDRSTMGEDLFWAIRGGGGTSFGIVLEFKVTLVTVPEKVTVFNVTRVSDKATDLVHRWQYIADKVDDDLLLRLFLSSTTVASPTGKNKTISASFVALYLGPILGLLPLMQEKFPELELSEQDCTEMSWVESTLYFAGISEQPLDALLNRTSQGIYAPSYSKGKSDYVSRPISKNGLRSMWRFLHEEAEEVELQFSPYGGVLDTFSESETPFPHRKGNIFMIHYGLSWRTPDESSEKIESIRRFYSFMACYVTKTPRAAYFNYRDLDIGRNDIEGKVSYQQASVWGLRYFKDNFRRLVRVKTKVDPSNFFRNEQSIPPISYDMRSNI